MVTLIKNHGLCRVIYSISCPSSLNYVCQNLLISPTQTEPKVSHEPLFEIQIHQPHKLARQNKPVQHDVSDRHPPFLAFGFAHIVFPLRVRRRSPYMGPSLYGCERRSLEQIGDLSRPLNEY